MLGTASQILTVSCLVNKSASLKGGVLSAKDASSLILAAFSLLNVKMAMISCFTMLLFMLVMVSVFVSLMCNKCDSKNFISRKGTTTFNIWALIYETIETSTIDTVIKFVCHCVSDNTPTMSESENSHSLVSGSASLSFATNNSHNQNLPAFLPNGAQVAAQCRMSHSKSMETMETTFMNHCSFGFQV